MKAELVKIESREIVSYATIELPIDVAMPTVILWRKRTFVLGTIGGESLYFEADVFDATESRDQVSR